PALKGRSSSTTTTKSFPLRAARSRPQRGTSHANPSPHKKIHHIHRHCEERFYSVRPRLTAQNSATHDSYNPTRNRSGVAISPNPPPPPRCHHLRALPSIHVRARSK